MQRMFVLPFSNSSIAKELQDIFSAFTPSVETMGALTKIPCQLFNDHVTERLCSLRRDELHGTGEFSCSGCIHCE